MARRKDLTEMADDLYDEDEDYLDEDTEYMIEDIQNILNKTYKKEYLLKIFEQYDYD